MKNTSRSEAATRLGRETSEMRAGIRVPSHPWMWGGIQAAIAAVLIGLLLWRANLRQAASAVSEGNYIWVMMAVPLLLLAMTCWSYRSQLALKKLGPSDLRTVFQAYFTANMVNSLLPMRMGDWLRVQVLSRRYGFPPTSVASTIFVTETLFDGMVFVILFLWTLTFFGIPHILLNLAWMIAMVIIVSVVVAAIASRLELVEGWEERWQWLRRLPQRIRKPIVNFVPEFVEGLSLLADFPLAARAFAASLSAWMLQAGLYWAYARVFGIDISPVQAVTVMITAALVASVPLVPTSLGTYEAAITGVLLLLGIPNGEALAYAVGSHALNIMFSASGGLVCMWLLRLGPRDLFPGARRRAAAGAERQQFDAGA